MTGWVLERRADPAAFGGLWANLFGFGRGCDFSISKSLSESEKVILLAKEVPGFSDGARGVPLASFWLDLSHWDP